jgi:hypothetical protein
MESLAQWGLFVLCSLCETELQHQELGRLGACGQICDTLAHFTSSPEVCQRACHSIGLFSRTLENSSAFGRLGACAQLNTVLITHIGNDEVMEEACMAIGKLIGNPTVHS